MSDSPDTERTVENISEEIHNVLKQLKYEKYALIAHSISGIYCLYYANKYPDEVETFIGIDTSIPQQIEIKELIEQNLQVVQRGKKIQKTFKEMFDLWKFLKTSETYRYSIRDRFLYVKLSIEHLDNSVAVNELLNAKHNFNMVKNMKFPPNVSVLFLLAEKSIEMIPQWVEWHQGLLADERQKNRTTVLQGEHYLHVSNTDEIAKEIKLFLDGNMDLI